MPKLLLFAILGLIVYLLLKRNGRNGRNGGNGGNGGNGHDAQSGRGQRPAAGHVATQQMVACAHCGVYVPETESLSAAGRHYCTESHRKLGVSAVGVTGGTDPR